MCTCLVCYHYLDWVKLVVLQTGLVLANALVLLASILLRAASIYIYQGCFTFLGPSLLLLSYGIHVNWHKIRHNYEPVLLAVDSSSTEIDGIEHECHGPVHAAYQSFLDASRASSTPPQSDEPELAIAGPSTAQREATRTTSIPSPSNMSPDTAPGRGKARASSEEEPGEETPLIVRNTFNRAFVVAS